MRALTEREQRTIRISAIGIAIYLVLFFGWRGWKYLETSRTEYQQLVADAQKLKRELDAYETRALLCEKLRKTFNLDPSKLSRTALVASASAAIQKAAMTGGVQMGPLRESPPRPSTRELASMQLEANGPALQMMTWLHRLQTLGFPMILDSVQLTTNPMQPGGMVKANVTIVILDYEAWKTKEARHA